MAAGVGSAMLTSACAIEKAKASAHAGPDYSQLDAALEAPVLKRELFPNPVMIESCDLLEYNGNYMIRVRSTDGAEGYCVGHNFRMPHLHPIQLQLVNPYFPLPADWLTGYVPTHSGSVRVARPSDWSGSTVFGQP